MPRTSLAYRALLRAATALAPLGGLLNRKLARTIALRRGVGERLAAWGRAARDPNRPLAWFHAPSVGEGLQAKAVLREFRTRHPDWQVAYTYFSPSAEAFAAGIGADIADCLPVDTPGAVGLALDALQPSLLVFAKLDVWPELATRAAARDIPVALVAATVRPGSGRLRPLARWLLAPGYRALSVAGAISEDDAERLATLGVPRDRIQVTGDPRCDSVLARVAAVPADEPLLALGQGAPTLVAGSTWPVDEDCLLEAFVAVRARQPERASSSCRTSQARKQSSASSARRSASAPRQLDQLGASPVAGPLVVVDRLGVLAVLYGAGKAGIRRGWVRARRVAFGAGAGRLGPAGDRSGRTGRRAVMPGGWWRPGAPRAPPARRRSPGSGTGGWRTTTPVPPWGHGRSRWWSRSEAPRRGRPRSWTSSPSCPGSSRPAGSCAVPAR